VKKKMIRILHVDDEVSFLDLASFFLNREGDFEVDTAVNAESALEKMQTQTFDAVVADYVLSGMDGIEMLKIIRAKGLQMPFILFTGKGGEEAAVEALNHGADFYLQKGASPQIQFTELANMIRQSVRSTRSDEAAREGERFLSSVFSSIQDGISVLDKDLNIVRVNSAMEDWYSHKMPLVGKKCYDAYHARQARCDVCPSIKTIENVRSANEVVPKIGSKGEVVGWLDLYTFPMRDSKTGELSGVIEYVRDITDRRKAEADLHGALERYKELQGIIDKSPVMLVIWRPEPGGPVTFISDSVAQWGYRRDDFVSTLVYDDIIYKEDIERERQEFKAFVSNGVNDFVQEYRVVTKSGEVRWVEDHTYVRRDADGNPACYEGIVIDVTARRTAQQRSEELTSRLQAIVEAFPDLHFHVDAHGTILDYNAGHVADLYVPPQKFMGRKMQEVLPPDVGNMFGDALDEIVKTGRVLSREYSLEIEGESRFFEARFAPISKGHILVVVRNITARVIAEEALQERDIRFKKLSSHVPGMIYQLTKWSDGTYCVPFASEAIKDIFGCSPEDVREDFSPIAKAILPEDLDRVIGTIEYSAKHLTTWQCEYRVQLPGKSIRWLFGHSTPEKLSDGSVTWHGFNTDITERKLVEEALRKSEEKYRQLVDLAQEGIMMTDAEAIVRFANPRMAEMIGYPVHEIVGKSLFQLMDEHAADLARRKIEDRRRGPSDRYEIDFLRKDGTSVHTNIGVTPIMDKTGHYSGALGVVTDISDRKRYQDALEVANQKLNLLNQVTRHDALNQLSVMTGWLEVARETASEPPVQEYLKKISNAAETMRRHLDFTGDYQKMGVAKPEWIEVKTAFINGTSGFGHSNISKSVQVEGLDVLADPMFEKVFNNLVDNSLRHGDKVTKVGIRYEELDDRLSIIYEDDGVGIPKEEKEKMFQRGRGKHSGYGLFMVKEILGITGITIAEVGTPGKGVRFEISVPRGKYRFS
jgi:PAS domain S-box-containing protein